MAIRSPTVRAGTGARREGTGKLRPMVFASGTIGARTFCGTGAGCRRSALARLKGDSGGEGLERMLRGAPRLVRPTVRHASKSKRAGRDMINLLTITAGQRRATAAGQSGG